MTAAGLLVMFVVVLTAVGDWHKDTAAGVYYSCVRNSAPQKRSAQVLPGAPFVCSRERFFAPGSTFCSGALSFCFDNPAPKPKIVNYINLLYCVLERGGNLGFS